eukprot:5794323-Prymnesium_polylepis.1
MKLHGCVSGVANGSRATMTGRRAETMLRGAWRRAVCGEKSCPSLAGVSADNRVLCGVERL